MNGTAEKGSSGSAEEPRRDRAAQVAAGPKPSFAKHHKKIGSAFLVFSLSMLLLGGLTALVLRAELYRPGLQIVDPNFFSQMTAAHALLMIFGMIIPAFSGFAHWMLPLMLGREDMAYPRLSAGSFWLLPLAVLVLMVSFVAPGGGPAAGWNLYPALALQAGDPFPLVIIAVQLFGLSSILTSINIVATVQRARAAGQSLAGMPMFVQASHIGAWLLIVVMSVLAVSATMLLVDRYFDTAFFSQAADSEPILFRRLYWLFGHPEIYIVILPAFGIVSQVIPSFSRKPLFARTAMIYATACVGLFALIAWLQDLLAGGLPMGARLFFMLASMLVAVPVCVKICNWIATMWRGSLSFETPMLFALGFLFLFTFAGFTGLMLSVVPADSQFRDGYFAVAHAHYVLVPGALFAVFAGAYYWLPILTGRVYDERLGKAHFWASIVFVNLTYLPQHLLGLAGMPRQMPDYGTRLAEFNALSSIGAIGIGLAQLLFVWAVVKALRSGDRAAADIWDAPRGPEWNSL